MASTFQNPIIRGFNPDPTVCVVPPSTPGGKQTYYLSTSTFEYFPGCAIYKSTDVINWTLIGHALTRPSQLNLRTVEPGAGSWASTLRYRTSEKRWYLFNGVYHRYRPSSDERIFPRGFYVWTDDIEKADSWSDPIYFDNPGFDQDVFWDDDGKTYLSTTVRIADRDPQSKLKDFAIHISEIDLPTGTTLTPPLCIRQSAFGVAEGSHILKKDGWYYLFVAEGGTEQGHQEWVFRSKKGVFGPWEGRGEPLWYNGKEEEVQRTGHADIFADEEGMWWGVFLGVRPVRGEGGKWLEPQLGRETFLVKVDWENNWPIFNNGKTISLPTTGHSTTTNTPQLLEQPSHPNPRYQLSPTSTTLEPGWYTKNTPLKPFHSLVARPGFLRLHGSCYSLSSPESPSLLLRKQESHTDIFSTTLEFTPSRKGYEAGITVWWNMYSHACVGVTGVLVEGKVVPTVVFRAPNGETGGFDRKFPALLPSSSTSPQTQQQEQSAFTPTLPSHLSATASPTSYSLRLTQGQASWAFDVDVEKLCVSPPVGGAFAGVMFGVYACGEWEPVLDPADFGEIRIREG